MYAWINLKHVGNAYLAFVHDVSNMCTKKGVKTSTKYGLFRKI